MRSPFQYFSSVFWVAHTTSRQFFLFCECYDVKLSWPVYIKKSPKLSDKPVWIRMCLSRRVIRAIQFFILHCSQSNGFSSGWIFQWVLPAAFFFVEHFLTEFAGNSLLWAVMHMGSVMFLQTAERSENAYLVRKQGGHFPMKASEWLFKWLLVNGFLLRIIMDTFLYEFQSLFKW